MATVVEVLENIQKCEDTATAGIAILDAAASTLAAAGLLSCAVLGTIGGLLNPSIRSLARKIEQTIGKALETLTELICVAKAILARLQRFFRLLKRIVADLLKAALALINGILSSIAAVFNFISDVVRTIVQTLLDAIQALYNQLVNWIKSLLTINCGVNIRALTSGDPCATEADRAQRALTDALGTVNNPADFAAQLATEFGGSALTELTSLDQLSEIIRRRIDDSIQTFKNSISSAIDNMERACGELLFK